MKQIYYASRGYISARLAGVPAPFAARAFISTLRAGLISSLALTFEVACCATFIFGVVLCTLAMGGLT